MATIRFAEELETKVETIAEIQEFLTKKFRFDPQEANMKDIGITEDYHIMFDSKDYDITRRAFDRFLRRLGIPPRFGMKIPEDLLSTIVKKLRDIKPQEVQLFTKKNTIYGIASKRYQQPDLADMLEPLNEKGRIIKMARVGSEGFRMATLGPQVIYPRTGDKKDSIMIGIYVHACATGQPLPYAQLMTYRTICTNGVITGKAYGEVRWPKRLADGESAEKFFIGNLKDLVGKEKILIGPLKDMANRQMLDKEFRHIWVSLKKVVGSAEKADELLNSSKEERAKIIAVYRANRKAKKGPEPVTVCSAYEAFNNISALANNQPGAAAEKLQKVAGFLLGGTSRETDD